MERCLLLIAILAVFTLSAFGQPGDPPFLLPVEDTFSIAGRGTIAVGKIERGTVKVGDTVEIVGSSAVKTATIAGIEMSRKMVNEAKAGDNVGLLLRGIEKADLERGQVIVKPGSIKTFTKIKARLDLLSAAEGGRRTPIATGYRPQVIVRTASYSGTVTLPAGKAEMAPGEKGVDVVVELSGPAPLETGQTITLREGGRTVGTATVLKN